VKSTCGVCDKLLEPKETIDVAGHGPRCYPCFNRETADHLGLDFVEPTFNPLSSRMRMALRTPSGSARCWCRRATSWKPSRTLSIHTKGTDLRSSAILTPIPGNCFSGSTPRCATRSRRVTSTAPS
jgi:hypothetical protein